MSLQSVYDSLPLNKELKSSYIYFRNFAPIVFLSISVYSSWSSGVLCLFFISLFLNLELGLKYRITFGQKIVSVILLSIPVVFYALWSIYNLEDSCLVLSALFSGVTLVFYIIVSEEMQESLDEEQLLKDKAEKDKIIWMEMSFYSLINFFAILDISQTDEGLLQDLKYIDRILPTPMKDISDEDWDNYITQKVKQLSVRTKSGKRQYGAQPISQKVHRAIIGFFDRLTGKGNNNNNNNNDKNDDDEEEEKKNPRKINPSKTGCAADNFLANTTSLNKQHKNEYAEDTAIVKAALSKAVRFANNEQVQQAVDLFSSNNNTNNNNTVVQLDGDEKIEFNDNNFNKYHLFVLIDRCKNDQLDDCDRSILLALHTAHCTHPYYSSLNSDQIKQLPMVKEVCRIKKKRNIDQSLEKLVDKKYINKKSGMYQLAE